MECFKNYSGCSLILTHFQTKRGGKKKELTHEQELVRREKNRIRSKAYREKRKLQIKTLQEEVQRARLAAKIAIKVYTNQYM